MRQIKAKHLLIELGSFGIKSGSNFSPLADSNSASSDIVSKLFTSAEMTEGTRVVASASCFASCFASCLTLDFPAFSLGFLTGVFGFLSFFLAGLLAGLGISKFTAVELFEESDESSSSSESDAEMEDSPFLPFALAATLRFSDD